MDARQSSKSSISHFIWIFWVLGACLLLVITIQAVKASPQIEGLIGQKTGLEGSFTHVSPRNPDAAPDLTVTDFWLNEVGKVCYQLLNAGNQASPTPHTTGLWVDGDQKETIDFEINIQPGKRASGCFLYDWVCSPDQDELGVRADINDVIDEGDETNNNRIETWTCDQIAPVITAGPTVTEITSSSAKITWNTDEDADSKVEYDPRLEAYALVKMVNKWETSHEVILQDLQPATVYQFRVKTSDEAGNLAQSKADFFETLSDSDAEPPAIDSVTPNRNNNTDWLQYFIEQEVSDDQEVERVETYLDSNHIGTDYANTDSASGVFTANLLPGLLGIGRAAFFGPHTVDTYAYDRFGNSTVENSFFNPIPEPMRGDLEISSPEPDHILYILGNTAPPGTTVPITATAVVYEEECHPAFTRDRNLHAPYVCNDVEHAVHRIVFSVAPEGGSYQMLCDIHPPHDTDRIFRCNWNASGRAWGAYSIRVRAYADDGTMLEDTRSFEILQGNPRLETERQVTRIGNAFRVRLIFHNRGPYLILLDALLDNLTGFQPIQVTTGATYSINSQYNVGNKINSLTIDLFSPASRTYPLNPGASFTVEYTAIPILYPELDTRINTIGQNPTSVLYYVLGVAQYGIANLQTNQTDTGEMLSQAVLAARRASDYLIVTHPGRLFAVDPNIGNVNALLSTIAELAQLKKGILGYVSNGGAREVKNTYLRWGEEMQGSDGIARHFRNNGYLLLVGEAEIVGSWDIPWSDHPVHFSDNPYANTDNDEYYLPEVIIGRVIGDDAAELRNSIKNSVEVAKGLPDAVFDRTHALIVAGQGRGVEEFEANLNRIQYFLRPEFNVTAFKERLVQAGGGNMREVFQSNAYNKDLFFYRDHCNETEWTNTVNEWKFDVPPDRNPIQFGTHRPFTFACCCEAGQYENVDDSSIAEEFLQHGAGAYIGATEVSDRPYNDVAAMEFFIRWSNHPSEKVGRVLRDLKHIMGGSHGWQYWSAEYNLYGDPKFGATTGPLAAELTPNPRLPSAPLATLELTVPDYGITTTNGVSFVTIPGGGLLKELGMPVVPTYQTSYQLANGDWVQDVTLTNRSNLQVETDLNLKIGEEEWDCDHTGWKTMIPAKIDAVEEYPEQIFDWRVEVGSDGKRYLSLTLYPFTYYPLIAEGRFYKDFTFEVTTSSSTVALSFLGADQPVYDAGDSALLEYWLDNPGTPQDVLIATVIRAAGSGEIVDSLPMHRLNSLGMRGTFAQRWDTTGRDPGNYVFEAQVRDLSGEILDTKREQISIGAMQASVYKLVVSPAAFSIGEQVSIDFEVSNPGTVPLTGTAVVELRSAIDGSLVDFSQEINNLTPTGVKPVHFVWDTKGATLGNYHLSAYLLFDSRVTDPLVAQLTSASIYLPLVRR